MRQGLGRSPPVPVVSVGDAGRQIVADLGRGAYLAAALGKVGRNRRLHCPSLLGQPKVVEQHAHREHRGGRVGLALARDVRSGAVHRFEHRRRGAVRVDVAGRRQADAAGDRRSLVGQDVAEEVVSDDDVEPGRLRRHEDRRRVDVQVVRSDVRELRAHHVDDPLPEVTGVHQDVLLVHQREVLPGAPLRGREGVADHALDPESGVEAHFGGDLVRRTCAQRAAVAGIRTFGALAHDDEVHLAGVGERGPDTRVEASRPQVHVLVELEPQLQQQTPLEDSGRDARVTDRAEQDDVVLADRGEVRGGERLAGPVPARGAEVERCGRDGDVTSGEGGVERLEALIDDLRTDAVACDDSELDVARHSPTLVSRPMGWDGHLTCWPTYRVPVWGPGWCAPTPPWSACRAALDVVTVARPDPREQRTQPASDGLDGVTLTLGTQRLELRRPGVLVVDEPSREGTALDVPEDLLHVLLHGRVDDPRSRDVVAVLGRVGDAPPLLGDPTLVDEVDDELELVQHLEVRDLGLVAGLGQRLEAVLDELGDAAAQDRLLAEQVGLGLLGEGGLDTGRAQATDRLGVGECEWPGATGGVFLDRHQHRDAAAIDVLTTNQVTRTLRCDHRDVDAVGRRDVPEPDVEAVREEQCLAGRQARLDRLGVDRALDRVRHQHHDDVGLGRSLGRSDDAQALVLGLDPRGAPLRQADADVDNRVAQVQRVRMPLTAVADDRDLAAGDDREVGVVLVEELCHGGSPWCVDGLGRLGPWPRVAAGVTARTDQALRPTRSSDRSVMEREPRPIATVPDWTISRTPNGSSAVSRAASLSGPPVASIVTASGTTSMTRARNSWTTSRTPERLGPSARTLTMSSSRCTEESRSSSTILRTWTSLLSCFVTCSSGSSATSTTTVIREISGCSVGPTASEWMLNERRAKRPETRVSTPGLFSTSTDRV